MERVMVVPGFDELRQHVDVLQLHSGTSLTLRFVEPRDAEPLQSYFRSLSSRSRYNRFLGAISELPPAELEHFIHAGEDGGFSVIAIAAIDGFETIVGEARYAIDTATGRFEFALSVDDRWQGYGIGSALLGNLECRAAAFGTVRMVGDTLRSNDAMIGLARQSGFVMAPNADDWKLVRFAKHIDAEPQDIPCASWRVAAASGQLATASAVSR
jgi:GNAT superfamily N-acetyltransferase